MLAGLLGASTRVGPGGAPAVGGVSVFSLKHNPFRITQGAPLFRLLYTVPIEPFDDPGLEEMRQSALADDSPPIRFTVPDWWETSEEEFIEQLRQAYTEMGRTVTISEVDGETLIQVGPPTRGAGDSTPRSQEE